MVIYPALFKPHDDGSITVTFPDLPGCITEGKSIGNALYMARDALALWTDTTKMIGGDIPAPSAIGDIKAGAGEFVSLIDADPTKYERERKNKAVKRTVSLPAWMDENATKEHLSLSKVLQEALEERFAEWP